MQWSMKSDIDFYSQIGVAAEYLHKWTILD